MARYWLHYWIHFLLGSFFGMFLDVYSIAVHEHASPPPKKKGFQGWYISLTPSPWTIPMDLGNVPLWTTSMDYPWTILTGPP